MSTREQSDPSSSSEADASPSPTDHARMVLAPLLLILGLGILVFGPGSLLENAASAAALALFAVLSGEPLSQKWRPGS